MADIAALGISIKTEGAKQAERELDGVAASAKRTEAAVGSASKSTSSGARRLAERIQEMASRASDGFRRLGQATSVIAGPLDGLAARFRSLGQLLRSAHWGTALVTIGLGAMALAIRSLSIGFGRLLRDVQPVQNEIATLGDYLGVAWERFVTGAQSALSGVVRWALEAAADTVQAFGHAYTQVSTIFRALPNVISETVLSAVNGVIAGIESMVNRAVSAINGLIALVNQVPGVSMEMFPQASIGRVGNPFAGASAQLADQLSRNARANADRSLFEEWRLAANTRAWEASTKTTEAKGGTAERLNEFERMTASVNRHVEAMKLEAETYGLATQEAERYRTQKELENAALRSGLELTPGLRVEILALAESYGRAAGAAELAAEAQHRLDATRESFRAQFSGFVTDIAKGESALRSFASALDRIADRFLDMAANDVFDAMFGKAGTGSSFFGNLANGNAAGGLLGGVLIPGVLHRGGVVGNDNYPHRAVPAAAFAYAPRYHNGGIAGLKPDEVPAILQRGERVLPRGSKAGGVVIKLGDTHIDASGADPATVTRLERALADDREQRAREIKETVHHLLDRGMA